MDLVYQVLLLLFTQTVVVSGVVFKQMELQ